MIVLARIGMLAALNADLLLPSVPCVPRAMCAAVAVCLQHACHHQLQRGHLPLPARHL
jgi:hypothetical protein